MPDKVYKTRLVHKIYEMTDGGTLREPKYEGRVLPLFSMYGYESQEKALEEIEKEKTGGEYVILPVAVTTLEWK